MDNQGEETDLEEVDVYDWIMKLRTIGKKLKKKIEVFIKVITKLHLGLLIKSNIGLLKEEKLSLQIKIMRLKHMVKIRILLGPNLQFA